MLRVGRADQMKPIARTFGLWSTALVCFSMTSAAQELTSPLTFSAPQQAYEGARLDTTDLLEVSDGRLVVGGPTPDGKPQVVFFFATYCQHCEATVAALNATYAKLRDSAERPVIGASISPIDSTREFVARTGAEFPVGVFAEAGGVLNSIGVRTVPAIVVIRGNGDVAFSRVGLTSGDDAASMLEAAYIEALKSADPTQGAP